METIANNSVTEVLKGIQEDFQKHAVKVLKKGIREIDKLFDTWEAEFEALAAEVAVHDAAIREGERQSPRNAPLNEEKLHEILEHLRDFDGFPLAGFMEKILQDPELNLGLDPKQPAEPVTNILDHEFWENKPGDTFGRRLMKRRTRMSQSWAKFLGLASSKKPDRWGVQKFPPRLLAQYYLGTPVASKLIELFEKRISEHAQQFNHLHAVHEKAWRSSIMAASIKFGSNDENTDGISARKEATQEPRGSAQKILSPLNSYVSGLEEVIAGKTTDLLEQGSIAGTKLLPEYSFGSDAYREDMTRLEKEYRESDAGFRKYFIAEGNDWIKDLEIIIIQVQTISITGSTIAQLQKKIDENITPKLDHLLQLVKNSFDRIKESENSPHLKEKILQESRQALRDLRLKSLPELIDAYSKASLVKTLDNYDRRISHKFDTLNDEYKIIQRLDIRKTPPEISTRTINLKKIIGTEYLAPLTRESEAFNDEAEQYLSRILRTLNEIGHMIQVNLETAMEMLDTTEHPKGKKEDVGKVLSDGLDRIYGIIEKTGPESHAISKIWGRKLEGISSEYMRGIDELLDNENILDLIIRTTKADAKRQFADLRHRIAHNTRAFLHKSWKLISFGLTGARSGYEQLSKVSGTASLSDNEKEMMNFLYTTRQRIARLPFIYQRLYRFEALKDQSIFVGRSSELERLEECYQLWRGGNFATVAIVGEKGSGRTSLLNVAQASILKQGKLSRIKMPKGVRTEAGLLELMLPMIPDKKPASIEELEKAFNELSSPVTIIVEDLHNLFIRTVDGFDIVERFLLLLSRTPGKVFWMVSCGSHMWNYLEKVLSIDRYFYDIIELNDLDVETTKEIILKRHRLSGYQLEYIPGKEVLSDRRYKKLPDDKSRQDYLEGLHFKHLYDLSKGNISSALLLWQLSVDSIKPNKVMISSDLSFNPGFLGILPEDELFTLGALVEHEVLTVEEHSEIFHQDISKSELTLLGLKNKGTLITTSDGFQVHFLLYKQLLRVLGDRNILK